MRLHAIQMVSTDDVAANLAQASALIAEAAPQAGDLVLLPENFALMAKQSAYWQLAETLGDGPVQEWLAALARQHAIYLIAGSFPIRCDGEQRCYTSCLAYSPSGEQLAHYHKLHLFDVDIADNQRSYRESDSFVPGERIVSFQAGDYRVGLSICFDLRFPRLYQLLAEQGCDMVVVPAAFTAHTGAAHWHSLLSARAIENQCYLVAANQGGVHVGGRQTWGHSMIVDPWGRRLAIQEQGPGVASSEFNPELITDVRQSMPLKQHALLKPLRRD
ncbi:carbon-nitrogen hydrolase family protein [Aliagarivorans marinus]|uniref:carbon-nitrogen hydrolase family protein n=1 Tax=Aliagarivorans marinus TaxID=561965 RepID=UPI0003F59230|nr:carbon-nitrogen hydrolase family protein [Aliagarivorans marinus]